MKSTFHIILKLLLVLAIFLGLQGKVVVRYAEIFHQNHQSGITHSAKTQVKASIIHCKLQCYTRHFQALNVPVAALLLAFTMALLMATLLYKPFKEKSHAIYRVRLIPLRAPPVF